MSCFLFSNRYLTGNIPIHVFPHYIVVREACLQVHKFGYGSLYGTVISAYYSGIFQLLACVVARHLHLSRHALAYVYNRNATVAGLF